MGHPEESITGWFHALRDGDDAAAEQLWNRYFHRLTGFARTQLANSPVYDEEDLAVSVFDALCQATRDGRYENVENREELWRLLVTISNRKAIDRYRHVTAQRRSGNQSSSVDLDAEIASAVKDPAWEVTLAEQCQTLINALDEGQMRDVALLKLEDLTNQQIADQLKVSERTVRRTIHLIRRIWQQELEKMSE